MNEWIEQGIRKYKTIITLISIISFIDLSSQIKKLYVLQFHVFIVQINMITFFQHFCIIITSCKGVILEHSFFHHHRWFLTWELHTLQWLILTFPLTVSTCKKRLQLRCRHEKQPRELVWAGRVTIRAGRLAGRVICVSAAKPTYTAYHRPQT